ncbi:hypothetical protein J3F83DRAFT_395791 [Trichoderma novae-zelandiae]
MLCGAGPLQCGFSRITKLRSCVLGSPAPSSFIRYQLARPRTSQSSHPASILGPPGTSLLHEAYTCMRADDSRTIECTYIDAGTPLEARGMRSSLSCHHTSISQSYLVEPWNQPRCHPFKSVLRPELDSHPSPNFVQTGVFHWLSRFCRRLTTYFFLGQPGQRDNTSHCTSITNSTSTALRWAASEAVPFRGPFSTRSRPLSPDETNLSRLLFCFVPLTAW